MNEGRPSKYQEAYNDQAYKLALLGATDEELADFFEVNPDTIYEWQNRHPKFSESIKDGKTKADYSVAHKLYDKALGAEWIEEQAFKVKKEAYDDQGRKLTSEEIVTVPVKKTSPPDTQAISLWLRNRKADRWKDKIEAAVTGNVTVEIVRFNEDTPTG